MTIVAYVIDALLNVTNFMLNLNLKFYEKPEVVVDNMAG